MAAKNIEAQQLYRHMRHPIMVAFLAVMWISPIMTLDRAIFALAMTIYQLLANSISQEDIDYVEDTLWSSFQSLKASKPKLG